LQGAQFVWLTDHKGLVHLLNQRNLSGRQARWIEKLGKFDFEVKYLPGVENLLPDALSRMYAFDAPGTVRTPSEYVQHNMGNNFARTAHLASMPMIVGEEALATNHRHGGRVAVLATSPQPDALRASGPDLRHSARMAWQAIEPIVAAAPYALGRIALRQGVLPLPSDGVAEPTPPRTRRCLLR
jgi:hypothetical protein